MCGICGVVSFGGAGDDASRVAKVRTMVGALAHRGPDGSGVVASGRGCLGATRLAIRGIEGGCQPMRDAPSGVVAVCNGEIDNAPELRRWLETRGRSAPAGTDVAVIVPLYLELGAAFVERLVGAFAVAVWDPRDERLLLARDRAGERFLFLACDAHGARFASEIAALACATDLSLHVSPPSIAHFLRAGHFEAPASPFAELEKVAPGELVECSRGGLVRRRYAGWKLRVCPPAQRSEDAFEAVFRAAVLRQTDVDVGCGVFLSGGLDSSLVAAVAREVRPDRALPAYTLRFREASYDEGDAAERVATLLGLEQVSVRVEPEAIPQELSRLIRLVGEPVADQSWIPTALLARRAAADVKLALVGEGADEIFGGYPTYIGAGLASAYGALPGWVRAAFARAVLAWPPSDKKVAISFLLKRFVQGWDLDGVSRHLLWTSNLPPSLLSRLLAQPPPPRRAERTWEHLLDAVQEQDFATSLSESLLAEKDRGSMSAAVELRCPFLDPDVLGFAQGLPPGERVRGGATKVFLKRVARRHLPRDVVHRRKRGLSVPFDTWLRGPLSGWAAARLRSELLDEVGVSSRAAGELLAEHQRRVADHARALWTLLVLAEWLEWAATLRERRGTGTAPGPPVARQRAG